MIDEYLQSRNDEALNYMPNDTKKAIKIFEEVIEIDPENIDAINGKGSSLLKLKLLDEAEECFNKSLLICENPSALLNKAIIYKNRKDYENSMICLDKAEKLSPDLKNIIKLLKKEIANIADENTYTKSSSIAQKTNDLISQGINFKNSKKLWDALDCFREAISMNPTCENTVIEYISEIRKEIHGQFLFNEPHFEDTKIYRLKIQGLRALSIEENPEKSLKIMNIVLKIDANDLDMINHKGGLMFLLNKNEEAIGCFDDCLIIDETYYYAKFNKALVLRTMNNLDDALKCFDELLEIPMDTKMVKSYQLEILKK